jgi:hypothetical protein
MNPRKNKICKYVWFENEKEYQQFLNAITQNDKELVLDIIWLIYARGDL